VQGRKLKLTNLDKILYPATGFTKGEVVDYYVRIAPSCCRILSAVSNHEALSGGVGEDQEYFFEKNAPKFARLVKTAPSGAKEITAPSITFSPTIYHAGLDCQPGLDRTPPFSLIGRDLETPTMIVFDLDPGPPANIVQCARSASGCARSSTTSACKVFQNLWVEKECRFIFPCIPNQLRPDQSVCQCHCRLLGQEHPSSSSPT